MNYNPETIIEFTRKVFEKKNIPLENRIQEFVRGIHLPWYVNDILKGNLKDTLHEAKKLWERIKMK